MLSCAERHIDDRLPSSRRKDVRYSPPRPDSFVKPCFGEIPCIVGQRFNGSFQIGTWLPEITVASASGGFDLRIT
jgi:hypothetical protein